MKRVFFAGIIGLVCLVATGCLVREARFRIIEELQFGTIDAGMSFTVHQNVFVLEKVFPSGEIDINGIFRNCLVLPTSVTWTHEVFRFGQTTSFATWELFTPISPRGRFRVKGIPVSGISVKEGDYSKIGLTPIDELGCPETPEQSTLEINVIYTADE